jgi:predicted transposase YdaD
LLGHELPEVVVVNADLATITTEADKILRVQAADPWIVHVEFETSHKPEIPLRIQRYNILARYRHGLPVQSIVVLLRPAADGPTINGLLEDHLPDGTRYHEFRYNVVRVWEIPAEEILKRDVWLLPLAPVSQVAESELPALIRQMEQRIALELPPSEAGELWVATYLLMGLTYKDTFARALLQGVRHMQESTTYQAILREGRELGKTEEARQILLRLGGSEFGPAEPEILAIIDAIPDAAGINDLIFRIRTVATWEELLAE